VATNKIHSGRSIVKQKIPSKIQSEVVKNPHDEMMKLANQNINKVIKLQALVRGFIQRKHNKTVQDVIDPKP